MKLTNKEINEEVLIIGLESGVIIKLVVWNEKGFFGGHKHPEYTVYVLDDTQQSQSLTLMNIEQVNMFSLDGIYYLNYCAHFVEAPILKVYQLFIKKQTPNKEHKLLHISAPTFMYDFEPKGFINSLLRLKTAPFNFIRMTRYLFGNFFLIANEKSELLVFNMADKKIVFELQTVIEDIRNCDFDSKILQVTNEDKKVTDIVMALHISNKASETDEIKIISANMHHFVGFEPHSVIGRPLELKENIEFENIFTVRSLKFVHKEITAFEFLGNSLFVNLFDNQLEVNRVEIIDVTKPDFNTKSYENVGLMDQDVIYATNNLVSYLKNDLIPFNLTVFLNALFEPNLFSAEEIFQAISQIVDNYQDDIDIDMLTEGGQLTKNHMYSILEGIFKKSSDLRFDEIATLGTEIISLMNQFYFQNNRIALFIKPYRSTAFMMTVKTNGKIGFLGPTVKSNALANLLKAHTNFLNSDLYPRYRQKLQTNIQAKSQLLSLKLFNYQNTIVDIFSILIESLNNNPSENVFDVKGVNYLTTAILKEKFDNGENPAEMRKIIAKFIDKLTSFISQDKFNQLAGSIILCASELEVFFSDFIISFSIFPTSDFLAVKYDQNLSSSASNGTVKLLFSQLMKYYESELTILVLCLVLLRLIKNQKLDHLLDMHTLQERFDEIYFSRLDKAVFVYSMFRSLVEVPINAPFTNSQAHSHYIEQHQQLYAGEDIFINIYFNSPLKLNTLKGREDLISWSETSIDKTRDFYERSNSYDIPFELKNACEYLWNRVK